MLIDKLVIFIDDLLITLLLRVCLHGGEGPQVGVCVAGHPT